MQVKLEVFGEDTDTKIQAVLTAIQGGATNNAVAPAPKPAGAPKAPPAPTKKIEEDAAVVLDEFGDPIAPGGESTEEVPTFDRLKELAIEKKAHKVKIKAQLTKFGSDSVTNLATEHYGAMFKFLNDLK